MIKKLLRATMIVLLAALIPVSAPAQKKVNGGKKAKKSKTEQVVKEDPKPAPVAAEPQRQPVPMPDVNLDTLLKHIMELSSNRYEGRLAGSQGFDLAANYVANQMLAYGLDVEGQPFRIECNEVENCKFNTYLPGTKDKTTYTLGNEFCLAGMTGRGYVDADMAFCGYGVGDEGYGDFDGVDVKGKIVVVLSGLPKGVPPKVAERYGFLRDKAREAEKRGAIGMLVINVSQSCLPYEPQGRGYCGELPHMPTFPMLLLTNDCGRTLLADERMTLDSVMRLIAADVEYTPHSFALRKKAEVDINARYRQDAPTANVIGILPGSDSKMRKEYITIGASLDGLGMQGETCLFPGADINASGVAALLETARLLSQEGYRPKRSVLFVLFSGGEQQYLGSRVFASLHPKARDVEAFVCPQNIGYGDSIVLIGGNRYPSLQQLAADRDTAMGKRHVMRTAEPTNPRGDARAFDAIGVPSIVITTHDGMHHNHTTGDYCENVDQRMLKIAAQQTLETVAQLAEGLYRGRSLQSRIR